MKRVNINVRQNVHIFWQEHRTPFPMSNDPSMPPKKVWTVQASYPTPLALVSIDTDCHKSVSAVEDCQNIHYPVSLSIYLQSLRINLDYDISAFIHSLPHSAQHIDWNRWQVMLGASDIYYGINVWTFDSNTPINIYIARYIDLIAEYDYVIKIT